jgi:hypothetical protein
MAYERSSYHRKWWVKTIRERNYFGHRYWWFNWSLLLGCIIAFYFSYNYLKEDTDQTCLNRNNLSRRIDGINDALDDCCPCNVERDTLVTSDTTLLEPPTNETIICIAVIDETDGQTQSSINSAWQKFRNKYPNREFHILQPASGDETFYLPQSNPKDYNYHRVNRDENIVSNRSDWYEIINLKRLPPNSKIALSMDISGSMQKTTVQASFDLFSQKIRENNLTIEEVEIGDEDYISPFIVNFSFN